MRKRSAFTILEIILTLALISIIIVSGTRLLLFTANVNKLTTSESQVQSHVRLISENINKIIRDASGIFLLEKKDPIDPKGYFTDGWNYLMVDKDKDKLIEWVWDAESETHVRKNVIDSLDGIEMKLTYNKGVNIDKDNIVGYILEIIGIEDSGKNRQIQTELEGINTLQVMDRSYGGVANTIAYRSDSRITDVGVANAAVSFVIDKSGSMKESLEGSTRIDILKKNAKSMIEGLSEYKNVYLSITPFSNEADTDNTLVLDTNVMYSLDLEIDKFIGNMGDDGSRDETGIINEIKASGATNTGDGMRRGFFSIVDFNNLTINKDKLIKNFMIILVDGETNYASAEGKKEKTEVWQGKKDKITYEGVICYHNGGILGIHNYLGVTEYILGNMDIPNQNKLINHEEIGKQYVNEVGKMIADYKKYRIDPIDVFVIGFSNDISTAGLNNIKEATNAKKVYKAETGEALEAILNEIKFEISDSLWHIGGPN